MSRGDKHTLMLVPSFIFQCLDLIPINRRRRHHRHRNADSASCGVSSAFCIYVSYGEICHGVHSMNYNIHTSSHYGDGLCHRKGYNTHFPDLCRFPQGYGSIRNVDTGCNNHRRHAFFSRKSWLFQMQFLHSPSPSHSVCSNRPRNGLKYCIPDIGAFCNQKVPRLRSGWLCQ